MENETGKKEVKIGYVRVSREKQDVESQKKLLIDMGISEEDIFIDHGISGWVEPSARPTYAKMLKRLANKDKPKVDTIVFSEISRISRNSRESVYELMRLEKAGFKIQSLSQSEAMLNNLDPTFQLVFLAAVGLGCDLERKHHQERTIWALENVRANGSKSGRKIGRPRVEVDFKEIKNTMEKYDVSENVARKICGYCTTTFYARKKEEAVKNV